jgi:hypothetical protein
MPNDMITPTDWSALRSALAEMDGAAWDEESERLDDLWKAEYKAAFVAHALTHPGWNRENAEAWADDIVDDALASCRSNCTPGEVAQVDVLECEMEAAIAC